MYWNLEERVIALELENEGRGGFICNVFVIRLGMEKRIALLDAFEGAPVGPSGR